MKTVLVYSLLILPVGAAAVTPEQCVLAYTSHARRMEASAASLHNYGSTSTLGGTTASPFVPFFGIPAVFGGTSVGSTADSRDDQAKFAANVAQSISEASGRVAGPFITQVTKELNSALYGWVASGSINEAMNRETARRARERLQDRKVTVDDTMDAITHLARSGALCDAQGNPLDRGAWAQMLVMQIASPVQH